MKGDNRQLQGVLMEQHRRIINEIADIKDFMYYTMDKNQHTIHKREN